jgi:hypothetical protein
LPRVARRPIKETCRFVFGGMLYQAEFNGGDLRDVFVIDYRISSSGVQEMKRQKWWWNARYHYSSEVDPAIINAARSARRGNRQADLDIPFREQALARLRERRAKRARELAVLDATIASMEAAT